MCSEQIFFLNPTDKHICSEILTASGIKKTRYTAPQAFYSLPLHCSRVIELDFALFERAAAPTLQPNVAVVMLPRKEEPRAREQQNKPSVM